MNQLDYRWTAGRVRKFLLVRWWSVSLAAIARSFVRWLVGVPYHTDQPRVELDNYAGHNGECYCYDGSTNKFRVEAFGCGFWGELCRAKVPQPCPCEKITWLLFPLSNADDIEAYGLERLRAEYPNVEALE